MKLHSLNQVSIPVPCHENWNTMSEAEKGRFCAVCQKTVIDFSQMQESEIIATLNQKMQMGTVCGKFSKTQIKSTYSWMDKISQKLRYFALALLMAFGIPKMSKAQLHENSNKKEFTVGEIEAISHSNISGTVQVKKTHIILPQAEVQLWKSNQLVLSTKTNNNGFYQLKGIQSGTYTLKVYRKDYVPYVLNDVQVEENTNYTYNIELLKTPQETKPDKKHIMGKINMRD